MSETKFTPGPWQSKNEYDWHEIIGSVDGGYGDDGSQIRYTNICEVSDDPDDAGEANARLIASAPDLLAALKGLLAEGSFPTEAEEKAIAAIKKAETK